MCDASVSKCVWVLSHVCSSGPKASTAIPCTSDLFILANYHSIINRLNIGVFPDMDPAFVLSPLIFAAFSLAYWAAAPHFDSERKRAYILSTISSFCMTCVSLPYLWIYLVHGLGGLFERGQEGWLSSLGKFGVIFFGTYLFGELAKKLRAVADNS